MRQLRKGTDPNQLIITVNSVSMDTQAEMKHGILDSAIIIKIKNYNLEDLLIQMLEDYGENELINKIKSLE